MIHRAMAAQAASNVDTSESDSESSSDTQRPSTYKTKYTIRIRPQEVNTGNNALEDEAEEETRRTPLLRSTNRSLTQVQNNDQ